MTAARVIKSDAEFFNTGTWTDGTWRRNPNLARGDYVKSAMGSGSVERNPADTGTCPKPTDPQLNRAVRAGRGFDVAGLALVRLATSRERGHRVSWSVLAACQPRMNFAPNGIFFSVRVALGQVVRCLVLNVGRHAARPTEDRST